MSGVLAADAAVARPHPTARRWFLRGFAAHGTAMVIQRGLSFVASFILARFGGPSLYGAFTLGMSTAGTASNYFGLAIGSVTSRYGSAVPRGTVAYRRLVLSFAWIALGGALAAALSLLLFAHPIATNILHNGELTTLVRLTGLLAASLIIQEATMGLFDGLLEFKPLLWLCAMSGLLALAAAAISAPFGASVVVASYAAATLIAVVVTLALARRTIWPKATSEGTAIPPRQILLFGASQVGTGLATSLASWWVIATLAAHDTTLHESGLFGVASQMRNLAILVPSFGLSIVVPVLLRHNELSETIARLWLFATGSLAAIAGGFVLVALPLVLSLYGGAYSGAAMAIVLTVSAGFVAVTASTLMRVLLTRSTRDIIVANLLSSACIVAGALLFVPRYGAAGAGLAWLVGELAFGLVVVALLRRHDVPLRSAFTLVWPIVLLFIVQAVLAFQLALAWRAPLALAQAALFLITIATIAWLAHSHHVLTLDDLRSARDRVRRRLGGDP